jgi:hypothetical protein
MEENRRHARKPSLQKVSFQVDDGPRSDAACRDCSLGGLFIETRQPVGYGVPIKVFLRLPGLADETVIPATVRWSQENGMGVQFGLMGVRETHALLQVLASV